VDAVNKGNRDAYIDTGTVVVLSVGADAMRASGVTMVATVVVGRAVVTMTVTRPAVTATSPPRDSRGNIVGAAS
jgi:hypothetical protein